MVSDDYQDLVSRLDLDMSYKYTLFSSLALLLYDITITLETEIQVVWRRRPNLGSFLHVINRYGEIGAYATAAVLLFPVTDRTCPIVGIIEEVFTLLPYIAWALFSGIRIHALSEGNVALAALVVVLNASYILPDVYTYSSMQFVNYPYPSGCTRIYNDDSVLYSLLWASRGGVLLGESLVLFWTLKRTLYLPRPSIGAKRPTSLAYGARGTIAEVVRNNGIPCFGVPVVLNVVTLALNLTGSDFAMNVGQCILNFRDALVSILISRYLLALGAFSVHDLDGNHSFENSEGTNNTGNICFTSSPSVSGDETSAIPQLQLPADREGDAQEMV